MTDKALLDGSLRMPAGECADVAPLWDVSKMAPKGAVTGCTACWAMTRSPALTTGHFRETCSWLWGDRDSMARSDALALLSVALALQNLMPSEATGQYADSMCSELGALPLDTKGQHIPGQALLNALKTEKDAVVPLHGPSLIGLVDGGWRREGGSEMFELPHVVRAVRQMVMAKGVGLEFMGSGPLVLAAPGSAEPAQKKSSSDLGGTEAVGLQMMDSSKFAFLSQFGPREWAAAHSVERVGSARSVTFSVFGSSKGTTKFTMTAYAPLEGMPFLLVKEDILATCEKVECKLTELSSVCKTVGIAFPIKDIGMAAKNVRTEVMNAVYMHPNVNNFYPLVEMLDQLWVSLVRREFMMMERDRPEPAAWHFCLGLSALATSLMRTPGVGVSGGSRSSGQQSARSGSPSAKGGKNAGDAARTLNGCCASFVAQMGSCSGAAPGSTCPTTHRRTGEPFKHECPCGEQHKAAACKKFKPKDLVAAAKALTGKK